jgi:hypothetical protein
MEFIRRYGATFGPTQPAVPPGASGEQARLILMRGASLRSLRIARKPCVLVPSAAAQMLNSCGGGSGSTSVRRLYRGPLLRPRVAETSWLTRSRAPNCRVRFPTEPDHSRESSIRGVARHVAMAPCLRLRICAGATGAGKAGRDSGTPREHRTSIEKGALVTEPNVAAISVRSLEGT